MCLDSFRPTMKPASRNSAICCDRPGCRIPSRSSSSRTEASPSISVQRIISRDGWENFFRKSAASRAWASSASAGGAVCSVRRVTPRQLPLSRPAETSDRSEEHTSELQSRPHLVCRLLLEKKNCVIVTSQLCVTLYRIYYNLYSYLL